MTREHFRARAWEYTECEPDGITPAGYKYGAAVAHVLEISDGKIVRFDQHVDSATINPIIGA